MNKTCSIWLLMFSCCCYAAHYDEYELENTLNKVELQTALNSYSKQYFTSKNPHRVIDELIQNEASPLKREALLYGLLTEVSRRPPQAFHQYFVDLMKTYPTQATRDALEGHVPMLIFNLNSKAHGIENIWAAYRTEQQFNQLFDVDIPRALSTIKTISNEDSTTRRPKWLGIKNSLTTINPDRLKILSNHLMTQTKVNHGLDQFLSHVGLISADSALINKALESEQTSVRQYTLRKIPEYLSESEAKSIIMSAASEGQDIKFSTSLLGQYMTDLEVQDFVLKQLAHKNTAESAAFILSQVDMSRPEMSGLAQKIKNQFIHSNNEHEKNHIVMALKLNPSDVSQLALDDLKTFIHDNSNTHKWLDSFIVKKDQELGQ